MIKLLLVLEVGARSRYWDATVAALCAAGIEVTVATLGSRGPLHDALDGLGVRATALGRDSRIGSLRAARELSAFIEEEGFDLVHAHEVMPTIVAGLRVRRKTRATRIYHRHHARTSGRHAVASRFAATRCDYVIAVSSAAAEWAVRLDHVSPARVRTVLNGVPPLREVSNDEAVDRRRELGIATTAPVVLLLARMRREKGHMTALRAMKHMNASRGAREICFLLVGDGPMREQLLERSATLGVSPIFIGHSDDVALYFRIADVVIVPSEQESFGLVAAEAMAASKPVIASATEGLKEIVEHDVTGRLVPPGDPAALAAATMDLVADPSLVRTMGQAGLARWQRSFTTDVMVQGWLDCYEDFLSRART